MSRTYRAIHHWYLDTGRTKSWSCFRLPKTQRTRILEYYAAQDLRYLKNVNKRNRVLSRGNLVSQKIVNAWDDIKISAGYETDWKICKRPYQLCKQYWCKCPYSYTDLPPY